MSLSTLTLESQADYAVLSEPALDAIGEIGDRLLRVHGAGLAVEPVWDAGAGVDDDALVSLAALALRDAIDPYLDLLERELGYAPVTPWRVASQLFHDRIGGLIDLSPLAGRCYRKPLGYAGDFEMMNMLYRNESLGDTLFGRALSRIVLDTDAAQAVRNRVHYLAGKIRATIARREPGQPARLLSVASGPAMEIQYLLRTDPGLLAAGRAEISLLDQDPSALKHSREQIEALAAQAGIEITLRCYNTSIRTVIAEGLTGFYDLIYSAGLFDYLKDHTARAAGSQLVSALAPGGQAVIGNFAAVNPSRPMQELLLDWPLLHRSTDDLRRLFGDLGSGITIEQEGTGVNLFALITAW
ncbi:MAG TPA: hypothetical protein VFI65_22985 [Streptosporangiaceae bacterium]|nr:hypothetical protein [Streptosporangiaceae bacterium]